MDPVTPGAPRRLLVAFLLLFVVVDVAVLVGGTRQLWRVHERATRGVEHTARILDTRWDDGHLRVRYMFRMRLPDGTPHVETAIALVEKDRARAYSPGADARIVVMPDDPANSDLLGNPQQTTGAWWGMAIACAQLAFVGVMGKMALRPEPPT